MERSRVLLITSLVMWIFMAAKGYCASWYVDSRAVGAKTGKSWSDAWESFHGINWGLIKPGDTVYISGGTGSAIYNEGLSIDASGTQLSPIKIKPGEEAGHDGTVIITNPSGSGISISGHKFIRIDGGAEYRIRITGCSDSGIDIYGPSGQIVLNGLEVDNNGDGENEHGIVSQCKSSLAPLLIVSNCKIHDNWQDQIHIDWTSEAPNQYDNYLIHDNEIYNISDDGLESGAVGVSFYRNTVHTCSSGKGSGHPDGVQLMGNYSKVYSNIFRDFDSGGYIANSMIYIDFYQGSAFDAHSVRIYNNLLYEDGPTFKNDYLRGIAIGSESQVLSVNDIIVANNTIIGMPAWGMTLTFNSLDAYHVRNIKVVNNIISDCFRLGGGQAVLFGDGTYTMGSWGDTASVIFDYNIIYGGSAGSTDIGAQDGSILHYVQWKNSSGCQNNVDGTPDPLLTTSYNLQVGSPAIDSGVSLSNEFGHDLGGSARPQGSAWDIGAYEAQLGKNPASPKAPSRLRVVD